MTFGEQNDEKQAHAQLDMAIECGVNLIDTAEVYSVPMRAETYGATERIVGNWLRKRGQRDKVLVATKVAGPADGGLPWVRGGATRLDRKNIETAIEESLVRLQTDYIDLYQLHWPDRKTNNFGQLGYKEPQAEDSVPILETLQSLGELVASGKVRCVGVSNETPWGVMIYVRLAEQHGLPRVVTIQNPYSLLNRTYEIGLAEITHRERVGLLAYSPLGFGVLSGKYLDGPMPAGARLARWADRFQRYTTPLGRQATSAYVALAREHGLSPAQMALAYVDSRPFVSGTIIGATSTDQLRENLSSLEVTLETSVLEAIEAIHVRHPNPCP